jgi:aminoglycoside 3-N-acetyltransferase
MTATWRVAKRLATVASLTKDLSALGVVRGSTVMVHTSLRALGYVIGGELACSKPCGRPSGTIVMPSQSRQLCGPAFLNQPDVPREWWPTIRSNLPAYDPAWTPTRTIVAVAELFRTQPGTLRSSHPH